jgi:hypothetical protein
MLPGVPTEADMNTERKKEVSDRNTKRGVYNRK